MCEKVRPVIEKWRNDYGFKTIAGAIASFGATLLFALCNGILGFWRLSVWHGSICVFYLLLAAVRGMILLTEKNNRMRSAHEKARCRQRMFSITAVMLLLLNLALVLPISLMVQLEKPVNIGLIPAIAMAAYTTYKITMASIHLGKQRRAVGSNILVRELRTISFIDALVSILSLQNTLIVVNQTEADAQNMLRLTAVSGTAIYLAVVALTVHLLVAGRKAGNVPPPSP